MKKYKQFMLLACGLALSTASVADESVVGILGMNPVELNSSIAV